MYPLHLASLFPPFPRNNRVFVAMSFQERFRPRWEHVIKPAVEDVPIGEGRLEPHRVDLSLVSDAVLTEIVSGVSNARLVLADITTMVIVNGTSFRNGNVLYEVGLAHALRQPQEVLLFRSDHDPLVFDVAGVRVREYDPDGDPRAAQRTITQALSEALREVEFTRHLAVQKGVDALDAPCLSVVLAATGRGLPHPETTTMGQVVASIDTVAAIASLLEMGILQTDYRSELQVQNPPPSPGPIPYRTFLTYHLTKFGVAVRGAVIDKLHLHEHFKALFEQPRGLGSDLRADVSASEAEGPGEPG